MTSSDDFFRIFPDEKSLLDCISSIIKRQELLLQLGQHLKDLEVLLDAHKKGTLAALQKPRKKRASKKEPVKHKFAFSWGEKFTYTLVRSQRKTISGEIREGEFIVRAPNNAPFEKIQSFLTMNQAWIDKHVGAAQKKLAAKEDFWETIWQNKEITINGYGQNIPISLMSTGTSRFDSTGNRIYLRVGEDFSNKECFLVSLVQFLKTIAVPVFTKWVKEYASRDSWMNSKLKEVKVSSAKTSWGTCTAKGTIRLNWKLLLVPEELAMAVVSHEVCHLVHMNHSRSFHDLLAEMNEDAEANLKLLKTTPVCDPF